jgi:hypothetical protein
MIPEFKDKKRIETEQQFLYILSKVVEMFPQYSISQHFAHIFRRKTEPSLPYFWTDEVSLRRIEEYYDELVSELANLEPEIED